MKKTVFTLAVAGLGLWLPINAGVVETRHNMSITGPGTVKATTEQEVCVFCHIPHHAQSGTAPIWNRSMPASNYIMYNSDYLRRMNYPVPTALGIANAEPGTLSRQCLSCHDGTVAVGSVYLVRGAIMGTNKITMAGVDTDGTLQDTAPTMFGTNLTSHHPVGIEYNHAITKNFNSGSRTMELLATPGTAIKLYSYGGKQYVECSSCHDPHTQTAKFLRYSAGGSHGANVYGTCTSCHEKTNWSVGAHATATNAYTDTTVGTLYGTNTVASLGCVNCHKPHKGEGQPYLLRKAEENTCFQGAGSGTTSTVPCHGSGGAKDIQSEISKLYAHPTIATQGKHSNLDVFFGSATSTITEPGVDWAANKHAECVDCHNPHQAKTGLHSVPSDATYITYPATPTNLVSTSGPLTGVTGVEPIWSLTRWTRTTQYATLESAEKEYQICMKCHSSWALDNVASPVSSFWIGNRPEDKATDQAWEFNPYNRSAHPVVMSSYEMVAYGGNAIGGNGATPGRYAPPLPTTYLKSPWNLTRGTNRMMCSDCHGGDNEENNGIRGPHGSSFKYMLKGPNKYWPSGPAGGGTTDSVTGNNMFVITDIPTAGKGIFCLNCHNPINYPHAQSGGGSGGMKSLMCIECHVAVPHGSPVSRLVGYKTFPEPYNFNLNGVKQLKMDGFFRSSTTTGTYTSNSDNVWATTGCGGRGGGCHRTSPVAGITYDSYP